MKRHWKTAIVITVVVAGIVLVSTLFRSRRPYVVHRSGLSGWQLVAGASGGGVTVGLQPPPALVEELYDQVSSRVGSELSAPGQPIMPIVLRDEFDSSLMGVLSAEEIVDIVRQSGIESASFEPVCMAEHADVSGDQTERLFFVLFQSEGFEKARADLILMHPEHGGAVEFDPAALRPILTVAATDDRFSRWWRMLPRDETDCQIAMRTE